MTDADPPRARVLVARWMLDQGRATPRPMLTPPAPRRDRRRHGPGPGRRQGGTAGPTLRALRVDRPRAVRPPDPPQHGRTRGGTHVDDRRPLALSLVPRQARATLEQPGIAVRCPTMTPATTSHRSLALTSRRAAHVDRDRSRRTLTPVRVARRSPCVLGGLEGVAEKWLLLLSPPSGLRVILSRAQVSRILSSGPNAPTRTRTASPPPALPPARLTARTRLSLPTRAVLGAHRG